MTKRDSSYNPSDEGFDAEQAAEIEAWDEGAQRFDDEVRDALRKDDDD